MGPIAFTPGLQSGDRFLLLWLCSEIEAVWIFTPKQLYLRINMARPMCIIMASKKLETYKPNYINYELHREFVYLYNRLLI